MNIAIAADHNGVAAKQQLITSLTDLGHRVDDRGVHGEESVDYPAICEDLARQVTTHNAEKAIMIGGTGSGEQIALNKIRGIRAGLCHCRLTAEVSRAHNDANVMVMGAKVISPAEALELAKLWLATEFTGGRHQRRIEQIGVLEAGGSLLSDC